jgi:hypothetical protein
MARDFPGTNGNDLRIANPIGALDVVGDITVAAWINPDVLSGVQGIATKENGTSFQYTLLLSGSQVIFRAGSTQANGGTALAVGAWQHVAGTRDASAIRVFLNGAVDGTGAAGTGAADTTLDFVVGARSAGTGIPFNGQVANVAVWSVGLTAAEIAALAKGVSPQMVRRASLVAHYPMWGISDAGELDLSGGGQSLTEVGTVGVGTTHPPIGPFVLL